MKHKNKTAIFTPFLTVGGGGWGRCSLYSSPGLVPSLVILGEAWLLDLAFYRPLSESVLFALVPASILLYRQVCLSHTCLWPPKS